MSSAKVSVGTHYGINRGGRSSSLRVRSERRNAQRLTRQLPYSNLSAVRLSSAADDHLQVAKQERELDHSCDRRESACTTSTKDFTDPSLMSLSDRLLEHNRVPDTWTYTNTC